jgi:hypothetical protein
MHAPLQGYLLPDFHKAYWIGLSSPEVPYGTWTWLDNLPPPTKQTFIHWGRAMPTNKAEPDGNFTCVSANASEAHQDPLTWGWSDDSCDLLLPFMCKRSVEASFVYASATTKATYLLSTAKANFIDAQATCNDHGGHLVSYQSLEEQIEVEAYFESLGVFIPLYHVFYWTGLVSEERSWPAFK